MQLSYVKNKLKFVIIKTTNSKVAKHEINPFDKYIATDAPKGFRLVVMKRAACHPPRKPQWWTSTVIVNQ